MYTLQRIMDAAFDNLSRIRLIWGRLWAALAAHLVAAACHADPGVSVLAVGHMRALVQRLLARSELSCFTHQVCPPGLARQATSSRHMDHFEQGCYLYGVLKERVDVLLDMMAQRGRRHQILTLTVLERSRAVSPL